MPGAAPRRRPAASAAEAVAVGVAGGVAGALWLSAVGLAWAGAAVGAAVGAANGALGGWRATYSWRDWRGAVAFLLDSTWALATTAGALATHVVAVAQRDRGGYLDELSRRANRHVYAHGFRLRRGFLVTIGNTVHGAGPHAVHSERRRRIVTDHEDVHVWQSRWFGPLFPLLYGAWLLGGGAAGACTWAVRRRDEPLPRVVETCAYYLNPFEWWAYSRDGNWRPSGMVAGIGWRRPMVRPLSERRRRAIRRARPAPPAAPG